MIFISIYACNYNILGYRVLNEDRANGGWGYDQFISHSVLESVTSDVQIITDNKNCFNIIEVSIID